jgi:hypothetical protein
MEPRAHNVIITDDTWSVELSDGRTVSAPIVWYPRLSHGTPEERANWELNGPGVGIHWPDLDEDISVHGLLLGRKSGETRSSLAKWLVRRALCSAH